MPSCGMMGSSRTRTVPSCDMMRSSHTQTMPSCDMMGLSCTRTVPSCDMMGPSRTRVVPSCDMMGLSRTRTVPLFGTMKPSRIQPAGSLDRMRNLRIGAVVSRSMTGADEFERYSCIQELKLLLTFAAVLQTRYSNWVYYEEIYSASWYCKTYRRRPYCGLYRTAKRVLSVPCPFGLPRIGQKGETH